MGKYQDLQNKVRFKNKVAKNFEDVEKRRIAQ
jgi:hypothetical protein